MSRPKFLGLLLVAPALALVAALFIYPLGYSIASAFSQPDGSIGFANFAKAYELYSGDIVYTIFIVVTSTALTGLAAIAIAGYLTMGETRWLVTGLAWLYRWPLFVPFIVAAQCMRTFLAKNGLMNNTIVGIRPDRSERHREPARLARRDHHVRLEAGAVRRAAARGRDGLASTARRSRRRAISAPGGCAA